MKLYYFNPNDYGQEAFVLAENKEKAKEYLLKQKLPPKITKAMYDYPEYDASLFHNEMIDDMVNLKDKYTLEEHGVGEVIFSEIS